MKVAKRNPILIQVSVNAIAPSLDPTNIFQESECLIFCVRCAGGSHFIARIKIVNDAYEYDGMLHSG